MNRTRYLARAGLLAVWLVAEAGRAWAHPGPLPREDNVWNGEVHQPVPSQVIPKERAAGIAPTARQQRQANQEVGSLYRRLMHDAAP